jgi:hypothetical protein
MQKKNSICLCDANANEKVYLSAFRKKKLEAEVNSLYIRHKCNRTISLHLS